MTQDEDAPLIVAARAGNARAFGVLVDRHQRAVRGFLRRLNGKAGEADDIAQEAFVRAYLKINDFEARSSFRTFVCGIAYRIWQAHNRTVRRDRLREGVYADNAMIERPPAMDVDAYLSVRQAMETLPAEQRAVIALCLGADFSHSEAADVMGLPLGTVKSHVARGREKLRSMLGENEKVSKEGQP